MRQSLIFFVTFLLFSCTNKIENLENFQLLPVVQEFKFNNGFSNLNFKNLKFAHSPTNDELPERYEYIEHIKKNVKDESNLFYSIDPNSGPNEEGYKLNISKDKITIVAHDEPGLFYAFVTLNQILEDSEQSHINLPLVTINDYPKLKFRPIHIDVKHHLEKKSYYFDLIDELAKLKINGIIVEFEDKLKYESRDEVGSSDAMSIDWWGRLSDYAMERNIAISPLVQGLGHASYILKHKKNKFLRDKPESDWAFNPLLKETYDLQFDLYRDAIKATPHGKYLHVGGDEVHLNERNGKSELELNLIWLNKVSEFAKENNRIPIFWDDMPLKHAGLYRPMFDSQMSVEEVDKIWTENEKNLQKFIDKFPKNAIYMRWNYQKSETYGNQKVMKWYTNNGLKVMGATAGQTRWTLMPQNQSNIPQIKSFALSSIEKKLDGLLLTLWDDDSPHFELYKRGITAFSNYTWSGKNKNINEFKQMFRHRMYGKKFYNDKFGFIDKLEKPVGNWLNMLLKDNVRRAEIAKSKNPLDLFIMDLPDLRNPGNWSVKNSEKIKNAKSVLKVSKEVEMILKEMIDSSPKNIYSLNIYNQVNELVKFSSHCVLMLEKLDKFSTDNNPNLDDRNKILNDVLKLEDNFNSMRKQFEYVYSRTRILEKPNDYILDQDHHNHPANQSKNFDWQFFSEIYFLEKLKKKFIKA